MILIFVPFVNNSSWNSVHELMDNGFPVGVYFDRFHDKRFIFLAECKTRYPRFTDNPLLITFT